MEVVTTEGFRDILRIVRHRKPYSIMRDIPQQYTTAGAAASVGRRVTERTLTDGTIRT